ncbi:MAG: MBL fold metallo-hydrolase [Thermodesulfobacteriota bacterium]|nr:MBL fold metallo-hydrolase [Thermodesulfobacteriota bacterium]
MDNPYAGQSDRLKGIIRLQDNFYAIRTKWLGHVPAGAVSGTYVFLMVRPDPFGLLLFDTGGPGSGPVICDAIKRLGFSPDDLKGITISHWHKDHTGGLAALIKRIDPGSSPIPIYVGERDLPLMLYRMPHRLICHPLLHIPIPHRPGRVPPLEKVRFVPLVPGSKENPLAGWGIEPIATPGHTPGHTSFMHPASGTLLPGCGLAMLGRDTVGIVMMYWNRKIKVESALRLAKMDFKYLYPVHFVPTNQEIPLERRLPARGPWTWLLRILGCYPIFRYPRG